MCQTKVINIKDAPKDWRISPKYAYIGRWNRFYGLGRSKFYNPIKLEHEDDRTQIIEAYRNYLLNNTNLLAQIEELRGKVLVCYCAPKMCHGNVLIELLNSQRQEIVMQTGFNF